MPRICGCGQQLRSLMDEWGCRHCGEICCPGCGYAPEGIGYCPNCAQSLFGVYTRPAVVARPTRITAWWEAAAVHPARERTEAARRGGPR